MSCWTSQFDSHIGSWIVSATFALIGSNVCMERGLSSAHHITAFRILLKLLESGGFKGHIMQEH